MNDDDELTLPPVPKPVADDKAAKSGDKNSGRDNAVLIAAGMGIGSAALVAALMYANRGRGPKKKS
jgi:hypothetical protein